MRRNLSLRSTFGIHVKAVIYDKKLFTFDLVCKLLWVVLLSFKGTSFEDDWEVAQGCWRYIRGIFNQLEEFRSFELLRSGRDRAEYLLVSFVTFIFLFLN